MKYLLSMDGGGTKTAWLLTTEDGETASAYNSAGTSHLQYGVHGVLEMIRDGIDRLTEEAGCEKSDIIAAAFGVPCYGEYPEADAVISDGLKEYLKDTVVSVHNDVELGFAGSLCLEDGIHVVAGTGAIAVGRNGERTARSNGWHPSFSDEGSGYWLGMQTLSLFAKQADCRVERSALYSIVREELGISDDGEIIGYYDSIASGDRKKIAALQMLLNKAADEGDESALRLYEAATRELYLSVLGVYRALSFSADEKVSVSYSGGLFAEDGHVLRPFASLVTQLEAKLKCPSLSPVQGGILLAAQSISEKKAKALADRLKEAGK